MKKVFTVFCLVFAWQYLGAQIWLEGKATTAREAKNLSFKEKQKAFYDYCRSINVEKGYYQSNGEKLKLPGWKQFKRWEDHWESRIDPMTGTYPDLRPFLIKPTQESESNNSNWESIGTNTTPGGYAGLGRVNCIAFHPTNQNTLFLGTPSGGLWTSVDGGQNWTTTTDNLASIGVSDIVVDANYESNQTIFFASGDRDAGDTPSTGVYKSTDGGQNWEVTGLSFSSSFGKMRIYRFQAHPSDPSKMFASTNNGFYTTTNGAQDWTSISYYFRDFEFKPSNPQTMYGSDGNGKVYKSTDGGQNWTNKLSVSGGKRTLIAVSENNPELVVAIVANTSDGLYGIYKSTDSGENFTQIIDGNVDGNKFLNHSCDGTGDNNGQAWYDMTIAVNPLDANEMYVGGINTWKSADGGTSWSIVSHWYGGCGTNEVHADKHEMVFQPGTSILFEGNDGGIYKTTDNGSTFVDLSNTLMISQIYRLGVCKQQADHCINGLQDNGTKRRTQNGVWKDVIGGDGMECAINSQDPNIQYGEIQLGGLKRTLNNWTSSTGIQPPNSGDGNWITPFILNPQNQKTILAGYHSLYRSYNHGTDWESIYTLPGSSKFSHITMAPSDSSTIFFTTYNNLFKTTDYGSNWTDLSSNLSFLGSYNKINYITVKEDDPNTIWISIGRYDTKGVYQSTDGGSTWTNISTGLPEIPINCVVENTRNSETLELYAATDFGVYCKLGDENWFSYNQNLPNTTVKELEIYYGDTWEQDRLYAATYGRGLWKSPLNYAQSGDISTTVSTLDFSSGQGTQNLGVFSSGSWTTDISVDWISVDPNSGEGDQTCVVNCVANDTPEARSSVIVFQGPNNSTSDVTVNQLAGEATLTINPESANVSAAAGSVTFEVTSNTSYEASENSDWITLTDASGNQNGTVTVNYDENTTNDSRTSVVTVTAGDQTKEYTLVQAGAEESFITLTPAELNFTSDGGSKTVELSSNVLWTVVNEADWVEIDPESGNDNSTITVNCQSNTVVATRSTTIAFNGPDNLSATLTITQDACEATLELDPENVTVQYIAGSTSFNVTSNTTYSASENSDWLSLTDPEGESSGTVTINYDENTSSEARTAAITVVAGSTSKEFTITQNKLQDFLEIDPESLEFAQGGENKTIEVSTNGSWTCSSDEDWITMNPTSGNGVQTVTVTCAENPTYDSRSGTINFEGPGGLTKEVNVSQEEKEVTLSLNPNQATVQKEEGSVNFNVNCNSTWEATTECDWITLENASGENNGIVTIEYEEKHFGDLSFYYYYCYFS